MTSHTPATTTPATTPLPSTTATPTSVLAFWFGSDDLQRDPAAHQRAHWFQRSDEFDAEILNRFDRAIDAALAGELGHWTESIDGRLALILLCDQFTRNVFRGSARAFAGDPLALEICQNMIRSNQQRQLGLHQRAFVGMPLEHSELDEVQAQSVAYFDQLRHDFPVNGPGVSPEAANAAEDYYRFAVAHRRVIDQFGRYPHRNAALGRKNSAQEQEWLDNGGGF
ncbi:DUF924 domain-containing protein [Microbulbifer salipaludis]|uniref:DUF924 domain-containing protein n=1 Tax=Microbulbifer salipaludis TaxID=187980 RepID=A0ABS3E7W1_9GAMM|nr:DUF924 family protein [Microbulbifer salipaludis]MBN8431342.1 DUF924 domain-containing protein [Microbulbifer salipaludis]